MARLRAGLLGCGVVGSALMRRVRGYQHAQATHGIDVVAVAVRDPSRSRSCDLTGVTLLDDAAAVVARDDVDVVIELIGGTQPAHALVVTALGACRPVVTANKALLGMHGPELRGLAAEQGVSIGCEAAVGAGTPMLRAVSAVAAGGEITRIDAVLNGTVTFVLSEMEQRNCDLSEALDLAQDLGYAEADSTRDLMGLDAADKLALLGQLALGLPIRTADVHRVGVDWLTPDDVSRERARGRVWRLVASLTADGCARVEPVPVPIDGLFGQLTGANVALRLQCRHAGTVELRGVGAGGSATAAAVIGDLRAIAAHSSAGRTARSDRP